VDDFAFAKGQKYGTILLDLERQVVIDLLPDREAKTLASWLQEHPGIEFISRDRSSAYSKAIRTAAPAAVQIADRFHLKQNLRTATEKYLRRNYPKIKAILKPPAEPKPTSEVKKAEEIKVGKPLTPAQIRKTRLELAGMPPTPPALPVREQKKEATQAARMELYQQIHTLHRQGFKQYQITHELDIDAGTVSQYLKNAPQPRVYSPGASKLNPYKAYLKQRFFVEGCRNAVQLGGEIRTQGYSGGNSIVTQYVASLRAELANHSPTESSIKSLAELKLNQSKSKVATPRQISWWLCLPGERLKPWEQAQLQLLCEADAEIARAYGLSQQFSELIGSKNADSLVLWLRALEEEPISEYASLGWGIASDRAAVEAGISLRWNQGQTEGQVNRLKIIKRQMYNRAKFDLLRARVLYAA
jgi:transposase